LGTFEDPLMQDHEEYTRYTFETFDICLYSPIYRSYSFKGSS